MSHGWTIFDIAGGILIADAIMWCAQRVLHRIARRNAHKQLLAEVDMNEEWERMHNAKVEGRLS